MTRWQRGIGKGVRAVAAAAMAVAAVGLALAGSAAGGVIVVDDFNRPD
ncbi:MAG: hypothetical protein IMZ66_06880, partial [Planctomycetes bacterium]|nr:hypothetical protein [Planctomycetota bacterium]